MLDCRYHKIKGVYGRFCRLLDLVHVKEEQKDLESFPGFESFLIHNKYSLSSIDGDLALFNRFTHSISSLLNMHALSTHTHTYIYIVHCQ